MAEVGASLPGKEMKLDTGLYAEPFLSLYNSASSSQKSVATMSAVIMNDGCSKLTSA